MLIEEHAAFKQAMAYLLARVLRVELVEEAANLAEARALALENLGRVDVVVRASSRCPTGRPPSSWPPCAGRGPTCRCSCSPSGGAAPRGGGRASRERALELGAARVISKESHVEEIFEAIGELGGLGGR